jgi:hypothetical protein
MLLDGNFTCDRHVAAFVVAMDLRGIGWTREKIHATLTRWGRSVGYTRRDVERAVESAFRKRANGEYRYHPPGLRKRPGTRSYEALAHVCEAVGCPANCPRYARSYQGTRSENAQKFKALGWDHILKRARKNAAIDVYAALCDIEADRGFAPGAGFITNYDQIARRADRDKRTVGRSLQHLQEVGLIAFTPGGGDGPYARNRYGSRIRRVVPIPPPPRRCI